MNTGQTAGSTTSQVHFEPVATSFYILENKRIISDPEDWKQHQYLFEWLDRLALQQRIYKMEKKTQKDKQSVIAIYSNGMVVEHLDKPQGFTPSLSPY